LVIFFNIYMREKLEKLRASAVVEIQKIKDLKKLDDLELNYFGRKEGKLNLMLKGLKELGQEEKKVIGSVANELKSEIQILIDNKRADLRSIEINEKLSTEWLDVTLPTGFEEKRGHLHPNTIIERELEQIFKSLGFMVADGPELESDYYNFEALNIPPDHPARDMQDTFYIDNKAGKEKLVMRTHTSNVQVRAMQKYGVPIRLIVPGRVFRYEATDASHDIAFRQLEGLMVGENISIANLIAVMKVALKGIFQKEVRVRLRPGYFPFVEPGFEMDMGCLICNGVGCSVCKQVGWLEILGCGLIHPNVLKAGGVDPKKYSGFAFGVGLTRLVMMRYGIEDIRYLNSGDLRFLKQF